MMSDRIVSEHDFDLHVEPLASGEIHVEFSDDEGDVAFDFTLEAAKELRDALTTAINAAS
jgi:hypothetical protein